MPRGGRRHGAGRPWGSRNRTSSMLLGALAAEGKRAGELIAVCFAIARDGKASPRVRIAACAVALPYLAPKLAAVTVEAETPDQTFPEPKSAEEAREILRHFVGDAY